MPMSATATTIFNVLGGNHFCMMVGVPAKNGLVYTDNALHIKIGSGATNKARYVRITLNGKDLFDVEFGRIYKHEWKSISKHDDCYVDMLVSLFETETGFYTRLTPRR